MAWWDEEQPGVQPNYDYGSALASFMGQFAGAGGQAGPGTWFDQFPGAAPAPSGVPGPGTWFDTFPLGAGVPSSGQQGPGTWFDTFPGAAPAAPTLGGYPGLADLYNPAYQLPSPAAQVLGQALAQQYSQPAPSLTPAWGTGTGQKLQVPQTAGRQSGYGGQYGAPQGQQSAAQQRQQGYGGQATQGLSGPRASAAQGTQPYTATGQQTGASGGATAAGAAGGVAPVAGGGVYGAQKWSSSMGSNAVDIFVPRGTPVQAPVSGTLQPGQNGQLILVGDNGLNFAFRHGQTTAQGRVRQGQQIGIVGDPGLDSLGNAPWGNMPDRYQHLEMSVSRGSPYFPATPGGGGNVDAAQWLESIGYRGNKIGRTPGPPDAQGGGMGMGGYGGTSGGGFNPFSGGMFGLSGGMGNPMQMLQGLFGGR